MEQKITINYRLLDNQEINMKFYEDEPVSLYLNNLTKINSYQSLKQQVDLLNHPWLGKILIINGEIQHVEKYQTLYHELLVHLPAAFVPNIRKVLVLGGGSLFAAHEVLKYPTVESVTLCDYDHSILDLMSEHYSHAKIVLQDPRFHYVESEGKSFVKGLNTKYDLIINDCFNLAEISNKENISYYRLLSNLCSADGVCVDIIYRHIFDQQVTIDTLSYLKKENRLAMSLVVVPEYPGILHIETIWGNSSYISQDTKNTINLFQKEIIAKNLFSPYKFYSPENLGFYLYLPPYIKEKFNI